MIPYGGRELAAAFRTVRGSTIKIAEEVSEDRYDFRASADTRSIGQTLVHIAFSPGYQHHIHNSKVDDLKLVDFVELRKRFGVEEARPRTRDEIVALLKSEGEAFASYLQSLPESFLAEPVRMRPGTKPETKSRFEMLLFVKEHEIHHQGQLMLLERMIGMVPHTTRDFQQRLAATKSPT